MCGLKRGKTVSLFAIGVVVLLVLQLVAERVKVPEFKNTLFVVFPIKFCIL